MNLLKPAKTSLPSAALTLQREEKLKDQEFRIRMQWQLWGDHKVPVLANYRVATKYYFKDKPSETKVIVQEIFQCLGIPNYQL